MSKPSMPEVKPVQAQAAQTPNVSELLKKRKTPVNGMAAGGTLLTGPSGVEASQLTTGRTTLLGG